MRPRAGRMLSGMSKRMPVAFVPHAGGPVSHVELGLPPAEVDALVAYWRSVRALPATQPKALLVVSAHWEAQVPTVMSSPRPPMLYDYGGFPPESYRITWPAPGDPALARRVRDLLEAAGFSTAEDPERGFDHGTFTPLKQTYPDAEVPVVQLSLKAGLDPAEHLRMGRALAPLRDEGVFIVGSGDSFHNLRAFGPGSREPSTRFNAWLTDAVTGDAGARDAELERWASAPFARLCHPREDHLIPLMVVAGAAGDDRGVLTWTGLFLGTEQTGYHFG
jgi:aromatic ring-opening dioxygenase catalytic subunit (LigB family)